MMQLIDPSEELGIGQDIVLIKPERSPNNWGRRVNEQAQLDTNAI